jgi:uncharacterized protein YegP (UPF0339 family)
MRLEVYRGEDGCWYWRCVAANNEIIATGESYPRKWNAKRAARRAFPGIPIQVVTPS